MLQKVMRKLCESYTVTTTDKWTSKRADGAIALKNGQERLYTVGVDEVGRKAGATHTIYLPRDLHGSGQRYAIIKKTRAKVVVDEDEEGNPVWETWLLKRNVSYEHLKTTDRAVIYRSGRHGSPDYKQKMHSLGYTWV